MCKTIFSVSRSLLVILAVLLVGGLLPLGPAPAAPGSGVEAKRELKVLRLSGSAYERGLQHGRELQPQIARSIALWRDDLHSEYKLDPDTLIGQFLAGTDFKPAIQRWTPDLLDEIRGIADGSGQTFDVIYAYNLPDEIWTFMDRREANRCSAIGVAGATSHPAYVAQNMDLETFRDGFQVVLHITETPAMPEQLIFTSAGMIAPNGMNNRSVALAANTVMELNASSDGLPAAFVVRGVLRQVDGAAALTFVKSVKHASGGNYIIGVGDQVHDFEVSSRKVIEFRPAADGSIVYHTNHRLVNDDVKPALSPAWEQGLANSRTRYAALQARLWGRASDIDKRAIENTLRSKDSEQYPVCRPKKPGAFAFTFGATIMTLSDKPSLEVSMGPPDVNPFVHLEFDNIPAR
jgi:hypothetical protein